MLECGNIRILVTAYQRVTGNNAIFLLSTICGDAMAILFEGLKLAKGLNGLISRGLEPQKNIWKSCEKVFESCHPDCYFLLKFCNQLTSNLVLSGILCFHKLEWGL